jgi:hypothetical protein
MLFCVRAMCFFGKFGNIVRQILHVLDPQARAISARDIARACSVQLIRCAILDYTVVASLIFMCDEAKT